MARGHCGAELLPFWLLGSKSLPWLSHAIEGAHGWPAFVFYSCSSDRELRYVLPALVASVTGH